MLTWFVMININEIHGLKSAVWQKLFCGQGPESKYRIVMPFLFFCSKDVTVQHSKNRVQEDATECPYNLLDILMIIHAEVTKISRRDWSPEIQRLILASLCNSDLALPALQTKQNLASSCKTDISEVFWPVTVTVTSCINCIVIYTRILKL